MDDETIEDEEVENTGVNPNEIDASKIPGVNLEAIDEGKDNNEKSEENSDELGIGIPIADATNVLSVCVCALCVCVLSVCVCLVCVCMHTPC